ncbi:hypothetical protein IJ118_02160 [Candidatus Saccharibacteria bacterium]|nr:hypothetical protein [Candidatus Saccharibacteria bacterium]
MEQNNSMPEAPIVTPGVAAVPEAPVVMPSASGATENTMPMPSVAEDMAGAGFSPELPTVAPTIPTAPAIPAIQNESTFVVATGTPSGAPTMNPATLATPGVQQTANPATFGIPSQQAPSMATPGVANPNVATTPASFGATDPLTIPEGPKAPDPVEEELKMPLKAAEPVPGSIGSAVSVSKDGQVLSAGVGGVAKQTPSVAFNDPATQNMMQNNLNASKPAKKKSSKSTLILVGVLGAVIIIALVVILISQLN